MQTSRIKRPSEHIETLWKWRSEGATDMGTKTETGPPECINKNMLPHPVVFFCLFFFLPGSPGLCAIFTHFAVPFGGLINNQQTTG